MWLIKAAVCRRPLGCGSCVSVFVAPCVWHSLPPCSLIHRSSSTKLEGLPILVSFYRHQVRTRHRHNHTTAITISTVVQASMISRRPQLLPIQHVSRPPERQTVLPPQSPQVLPSVPVSVINAATAVGGHRDLEWRKPSRTADRGLISPEEDTRKLFEECEVALYSSRILNEALAYSTPQFFSRNPVVKV